MSQTLLLGDCLELMEDLPRGEIDLILCDLPYGTTKSKWDIIIPFEALWESYKRILKPNGVIALTCSQPFTSMLLMSNLEMFKHEWIWIKNRGSNFANTVREPMKEHESVLIFSQGGWTYNKQMQERTGEGKGRVKYRFNFSTHAEGFGKFNGLPNVEKGELRVPSSWQKFNTEVGLHPNQKPLGLMEYLIKTYSNEGDLVLDNCMGSGTTGLACQNLGRNFIGIEKDLKYFEIASRRLNMVREEEGWEEKRVGISSWPRSV